VPRGGIEPPTRGFSDLNVTADGVFVLMAASASITPHEAKELKTLARIESETWAIGNSLHEIYAGA